MQKYFAFIKKFFDFFRRHGDDDRSLMEKLRDKYRLVIMNDDTFEEVTSMKITPLSLYVGVSSLIVGTAIIVTALIIWTPLKRYIPGYGDYTRDEEIAQLTTKIADLEEEMVAHRRFNENIKKIMHGDLADISKEAVQKQGVPADSISNIPPEDIERVPEDELLRSAVEKGTFTRDPQAAQTVAASVGPVLPQDVPLEKMSFMPPVSGEITASFDLQKNHFGIDVAAPKNTAIKAAANGVVISAGYTVETGYSIAIQHPNNVVTMYKHNSVLLKQAGIAVKAGEAIAIIGNTGENTTGPHLHFELWYKGRAVDPSDYINFN
ncbi:MAG: M23 family metallopeptidase [Saprospiraceae bacterium]|nr:M23 family metallopeptidase [Saprospiraceae bacterium]